MVPELPSFLVQRFAHPLIPERRAALCTGFHAEFPWLRIKDSIPNPRWFLDCFPERLGHPLFCAGYARPHQGGIPVMAEMLSRYIGLPLRGERTIPMDDAAKARSDEKAEGRITS